jgi:hypothetical protein
MTIPEPKEMVDRFFSSPEFLKAWGKLREQCADPSGWEINGFEYDGVTVSCANQVAWVQRSFSLISKDVEESWASDRMSPWGVNRYLLLSMNLADPFFHNRSQPGSAFDLFLRREIPEAAIWFRIRSKYETELRTIGPVFQDEFDKRCSQDEIVNAFLEGLKSVLSDPENKRKALKIAEDRAFSEFCHSVEVLKRLRWNLDQFTEEIQDYFPTVSHLIPEVPEDLNPAKDSGFRSLLLVVVSHGEAHLLTTSGPVMDSWGKSLEGVDGLPNEDGVFICRVGWVADGPSD